MTALGANTTYFDQHFYFPPSARQDQGLTNWNYQSAAIRKPMKSEGRNFEYIAVIPSFSNEARTALDDQISSLRRDYGFADNAVVTDFLFGHRSIRTALKDALPQLRATFGVDKIFNLEVSKDEDGSETMYAVAVWHEDVWRASEALHSFLENWWLQRMNAATSDLAFVYKLV
jgi:hypothetical protein